MWLAVKTLFLLRIKVGRPDRLASPFPRVLLFLGKVDKVDSKSNYTQTQTHRRTLREKQMKAKRNEKEKKKKKREMQARWSLHSPEGLMSLTASWSVQ